MSEEGLIHFALPKGRMQDNIMKLLADAGIKLVFDRRGYRPVLSLEGFEAKILKPQNIVEMLNASSRDIGFAGADWVEEKDARLVSLIDTGLDPVRIVAAAHPGFIQNGRAPQNFRVASEYKNLTDKWIKRKGFNASFVRSYGATEVFPPEDADCIVDNTATGATLKANGLEIIDEVMRSSTHLFANERALENPVKRARIEHFQTLIASVLEARKRVMIEINVDAVNLPKLTSVLPCLKQPTVSPLHDQEAFAVKAAVPSHNLPELIKTIKQSGGTDIIVSEIKQIMP